MAVREALIENFLLFGVKIRDEATLQKCMDLCDTYDLDEETLVDTWMAFSVSDCKGAGPNSKYLSRMERRELAKKKTIKQDIPMPSCSGYSPSGQSRGTILSYMNRKDKNLSTIAARNNTITSMKQYDDSDDILELYSGEASTTPKAKRLRSPEGEAEINEVKLRAVESPFSPASFSPKTVTPSRLTSNPQNRGKVLLRYGADHTNWKNLDENRIVEVSKSGDHCHAPSKLLYMHEKLLNKAAILDSICEELGTSMCKTTNEIENDDIKQVGSYSRSQYQIQTYGRICCDSEGKLNAASVMLEGSKRLSAGSRVKLDIGQLNQYTLFPGQIVSVKGVNPTGNSLVVKNLFIESPPPPPSRPQNETNNDKTLDVVVAAGPFTHANNLNYEPLINLIKYVQENKPHVVILIGPFAEVSHQEILNCNMSVTYQEFFEQCIENIMRELTDTSTQVVLVSSSRDVHHEPIYPTPEFRLTQRYPNLHLMPDPCMIDIDGLVIGTTSVDTLMYLGKEEISFNSTKLDRLSRLATHVLAQRCFYPLVPPSDEVNVDTGLWKKHAFINKQPHILVLPSNLRYFCRNLYDCVALNPERLAKGSFARLRINYPSKDGDWKIADNVAIQILKS